ncbi:hypothetical protein IWZ01DRAFT_78589 [Phyllosticta capitalensis]
MLATTVSTRPEMCNQLRRSHFEHRVALLRPHQCPRAHAQTFLSSRLFPAPTGAVRYRVQNSVGDSALASTATFGKRTSVCLRNGKETDCAPPATESEGTGGQAQRAADAWQSVGCAKQTVFSEQRARPTIHANPKHCMETTGSSPLRVACLPPPICIFFLFAPHKDQQAVVGSYVSVVHLAGSRRLVVHLPQPPPQSDPLPLHLSAWYVGHGRFAAWGVLPPCHFPLPVNPGPPIDSTGIWGPERSRTRRPTGVATKRDPLATERGGAHRYN